MPAAPRVYLDQNYLSGMVKRKPAFRELEPVLRAAVRSGSIAATTPSCSAGAAPTWSA